MSSLEESKDLLAKLDELTQLELNHKKNVADMNNRFVLTRFE